MSRYRCRHCAGTGSQSVEPGSSLRFRCPDCNGRGLNLHKMEITTHYRCRKCDHEIEVEVEIGEGDDLPEACPDCGEAIPARAHEDVAQDAIGTAADRARDLRED